MGRRSGLFEREADGTYTLQLGDDLRQLLATISRQLADRLEDDPQDPSLQRLFPTAYPKDPEREQEWRLLMSVDLHDRRREQLAVLEATARGGTFTADQLHVWLQALNDLRLYLGTRLGVSEETEVDDFADEATQDLYALYEWLGVLQEATVQVLAEAL